ncbi:MAG: hypothetical protein HYU74_04455 [Dechloromonas sp.]|nr:hypothetical protein [Dechloromonas sp.]
MKSNTLRKSGLGLLIVAGMMVPMASSIGEESKSAYGAKMESYQTSTEGNLYQDLQNLQSAKDWTTTERGAQGPIRSEGMDTPLTANEGDLYQDLQKLHSSRQMSASSGAQGPIRTETMDSSPAISDLYDGRKVY